MVFADRADAGRRLAAALAGLGDQAPVVLGLPHGGVPVAAEVARALGAPLDVVVVRRLALPWQPELAVGAICEDGTRFLDDDVVRSTGTTPTELSAVEVPARAELHRRVTLLREHQPRRPLRGRTVVVVDDGVVTGASARVACLSAREQGAARVVLAVPVASTRAAEDLAADVDDLVCLERAPGLLAVGQAYRRFEQVSDDEVLRLLGARHDSAPAPQ
ncbi:phosphoribosyltransferase [Nocardioides sediminis]|uniref:phosphoribosyltransferase n=1 Tax=Nocardioides sediminis TaxID=433648 RepID=UPI000D311F98|nr:phosphoribosyltransferase family protein [Nocardioides sediminis]